MGGDVDSLSRGVEKCVVSRWCVRGRLKKMTTTLARASWLGLSPSWKRSALVCVYRFSISRVRVCTCTRLWVATYAAASAWTSFLFLGGQEFSTTALWLYRSTRKKKRYSAPPGQ
ncbi:unnamed protein product [Ectocarpus fasciculatus]